MFSKASFGKIGDQVVDKYTFGHSDGIEICVCNYGARLIGLKVLDRNGKRDDIVCGFSTLSEYQHDTAYFGAIVGRYANRIGQGRFVLDGKEYRLKSNEVPHTLHGADAFDTAVWNVIEASDHQIILRYLSKNGEAGFPGNLDAQVSYSIVAPHTLEIVYRASTDSATPVNLSNHAYFNLRGAGKGTILDHHLRIEADQITEVDKELIPTGRLLDVKEGPFDFRAGKKIGASISETEGGYDHNFLLSPHRQIAAELSEEESGRRMQISTSQPGLQFYTGNFLEGRSGIGGSYIKHGALCLETQNFPDAPNHTNFPNSILRPGEVYEHWTRLEFHILT